MPLPFDPEHSLSERILRGQFLSLSSPPMLT
jgi:hypothetical protein